MTGASESPQSVMGRVTLLLEPFRTAEGLTLTELAQRTGFPRSTTHRMLLQLVKVGWISRSGTTYHLGPKMVELGALAQTHDRVHKAASPVMYDLHRQTGLVVQLAVLEGESVLCLEKVGGRWAADIRARVGQRRPAHETIIGTALLAHRDGVQTLPAAHGTFSHPESTIYGGQHIRCVAAAFDSGDGEIAALALAGPQEIVPDGVEEQLRGAADSVAGLLTT